MASQPSTLISPEDYLVRERAATERSEYYRGEIFAKAGASEAHNLIVSNLGFALRRGLQGRDCRVYYSDMRLLVSNPLVIIEVLSKSTKDCDRGGKFHQYMRVPSLQEYLTVSQTEMLVEHSVRQPDGGWLVHEIESAKGIVPPASLALELHFADIYEKVELPL